jgi:hypothetical protein
MSTADSIFTSELSKRGISYTRTPEGLYAVEAHDQTLTISLENVRRNFDRDGDTSAIVRFVDTLITDHFETPSWDAVRPFLRYSLEPSVELRFCRKIEIAKNQRKFSTSKMSLDDESRWT